MTAATGKFCYSHNVHGRILSIEVLYPYTSAILFQNNQDTVINAPSAGTAVNKVMLPNKNMNTAVLLTL
jgi:hypothetical protein